MQRSARANAISRRRRDIREAYWPGEPAWEATRGFFQAPRTLPLLLRLLSNKKISGRVDPGPVYVELWSRHMGDGIIELGQEEDHAYAAGYSGTSAVRRWRERMEVLERHGFIRCRGFGLRSRTHVLLRPPDLVVEELRAAGLVDKDWSEAYNELRFRVGEISSEELVEVTKAQEQPRKSKAAKPVAPASPFADEDDDLPF